MIEPDLGPVTAALNMCSTPSSNPEAVPARALWVQLATRITTQPRHYRSGDEETAARSLFSVFGKVRGLLEQHPDATKFRTLAVGLLNETLRPYTTRWHGWMTEDAEGRDEEGRPVFRFRDGLARRRFRQELAELRPQLLAVQAKLAALGGITDQPAEVRAATADLGGSLRAGIREQVEIKTGGEDGVRLATAADINRVEQLDLLRRRLTLGTLQAEDAPRTPKALKESVDSEAGGTNAPEVRLHDATGLALSGGGIRSATFCLGVVQSLVARGLFPQFDYLSTVSGGGYLGSFLSCALGTRNGGDSDGATAQSAAERIDDAFHRSKGTESGLLRHLRNHSKYLLHGGLVGKLRITGLLISGLVWNLLIVLPLPLAASLLAYGFGAWLWGESINGTGPVLPSFRETPAGWALGVVGAVLGIAFLTLPVVQRLTHGKPPKSKGALLRSVWENVTLALGVAAVFAGAVFLTPTVLHGYDWVRREFLAWRWGGSVVGPWAEWMPASMTGAASAVLAALAGWLAPHWPRLRAVTVRLFLLTGPLLLLLIFLLVSNRMGLARSGHDAWDPRWVFWGTLALGLWAWTCVNINTLAPHRYYRNRLCECYLARRIARTEATKKPLLRWLAGERAQGRTETLNQVKLTQLGADAAAPYHLLNMTLNAPSSTNKNLRGRGGDFFFASRRFCGSPLTGYARTEDVERIDPHFDLGTAMAVSAAAASTSMGWKSLPHFRFLMALLNVRLGYWLRRPGQAALPAFLEGAGPWYLFREMLGRIAECHRFVNLSDGGHIENLAAYELLRRQCRFIVCVDAGWEPGMECSDLVRLQRYAAIDLGVRLTFDLADLQLGADGLSRAHAILVKIEYPPDGDDDTKAAAKDRLRGWMLYVKLAVTGVEPNYVKDYRREHPDFPHQTTGDQIFEEDQFEAYRALGECAMNGMLREEIVGSAPPATIAAWFQSLADNLLPDNDPAFRRPGSGGASVTS